MQDTTIQISGLEPIIAPEPVPFWPPAPGWYVAGALLLFVISYGLYRWYKAKQANRYRKEAINQLEQIRNVAFQEDPLHAISELNTLLKKTALAGFAREQVASLSGEKWLRFLEASCKQTPFSSHPGKTLAQVGYLRSATFELSQSEWQDLFNLIEKWIRYHKSSQEVVLTFPI